MLICMEIKTMSEVEKQYILKILEKHHDQSLEVISEKLGISRNTLFLKLKQYGYKNRKNFNLEKNKLQQNEKNSL